MSGKIQHLINYNLGKLWEYFLSFLFHQLFCSFNSDSFAFDPFRRTQYGGRNREVVIVPDLSYSMTKVASLLGAKNGYQKDEIPDFFDATKKDVSSENIFIET